MIEERARLIIILALVPFWLETINSPSTPPLLLLDYTQPFMYISGMQ